MCRALKVLCVASDAEALAALNRASVSADWELAPGETSEAEAPVGVVSIRASVSAPTVSIVALPVALASRTAVNVTGTSGVDGVAPGAGSAR